MIKPEPNRPDYLLDPSSKSGQASGVLALVASAIASVALIAALVCSVYFGISWYNDAFNKEPVQTSRDDALGGAEQAMLNVLNIDLKDSKAYQDRLAGSVTGTARTQLLGSTGIGQLQQAAGADASQAATLTAKISRSAVVELNTDDNTAKTLVFLVVTSSRPNEASSSQTMGFQVQVSKDGSTWKASNITPLDSIAVDNSAPAASGTPAPAASGAPAPAPATSPAAPAPAPTTGAGN